MESLVEFDNVSHSDNATKGRINRMFKYFRNKRVRIRYEYNNSLGHHFIRKQTLKYDTFEILSDGEFYNVILYSNGTQVFEQDFNIYWEFTGLGKMKLCNSGPYCYFVIKKLKWFQSF
jgi:hypothetical protein